MRVTHVITRLIVGGAQENTIASVLGLRKKAALDVDLISGPSIGSEGSMESAFADYPGVLRILPELVRPILPWADARALFRLTGIFRQSRPDIVHTHSGKAGILGRLAASRAGVPVIVHTIHGPSFGDFQGSVPNFAFRAAERMAGRVTTHFVTVADAMKTQYLRAGIGTPEVFTLVRSGFDLEPFSGATRDPALRQALGIAPEEVVIGKIARLTKLKGHEDLVAIAPRLIARNPRIRFLFIGDGDLRNSLERRVQTLGLSRHFTFAGLIPPEAVSRYVGIMDLLVHVSLREGLARALPQALAAGRPVVAYDCDGAREVCLPGKTGLLVRPRDLAGLSSSLLSLVENPALREELGSRGRAFALEHFSVASMVDALHALYLRLVREKANMRE